MFFPIVLIILGLTVLIVGGEFLVKGAVGIAEKAKLSKLVIGMTVVSFGTSAPELIVSIQAAMNHAPGIAIGNVVGSNVANLGLVLAITVIIFPIVVGRDTIRKDWPFMMLATFLFIGFAWDLQIQQWEGAILVVLLISFISWIIYTSRKSAKIEAAQSPIVTETAEGKDPKKLWKAIVFLAIGLTGLFFGAGWLLDGAIELATLAGMEERVIGVTIVAFGTSVPELVTSGVAAFRKETDISIGNLIGSNIFNIMAVIGITSIIFPINVDQQSVDVDMIWMLGISLILLPMMLFGKHFGRFKGVILLTGYITYITILVLSI